MDLKELVAFTATLSTILQFLTGLQICKKIYRQQSTLDISGFSFVAGTVSCSFWLKYGILREDPTLIKVNSVGLTLFISYMLFYLWNCQKKSTYLRQITFAASILFGLLGYVKFYLPDDKVAAHYVGLTACTSGLVFCASPLTTVTEVLRTKSTSVMPFPLIVATFLVSLQWFAYGLLLEDKFVQVPNLLGAMISGVQLSLFAIYPNRPVDPVRTN